MRDGPRMFLAIEPAETLECFDARTSQQFFAEAVNAWSRPGATPTPHAFGWLAYDAMRGDEPGGFDDARPRADHAPLAFLARYGAVLVAGESGTRIEGDDSRAKTALAHAWSDATDRRTVLPAVLAAQTSSRVTRNEHLAHVEQLREAIRDGAVYLVNLTHVVRASRIDGPQLAARVMRARAPLSMLLDAGSCTIAGMSMELGLGWDRASGVLETQPIKGTRPRGRNVAEDAALVAELAADPKERAENIMAVDVHRNDLGRIARIGSVTVPRLCEVETHAYVHHLVSTVRAVVRDGVAVREVLDAMLPLGSVTGAPKRAAMQQIAVLEPEQRGVYTGVYGCLSRDGSLRLAVAIRTAVTDDLGTHYGVGGGIVADSVATREWDELTWKTRGFSQGD